MIVVEHEYMSFRDGCYRSEIRSAQSAINDIIKNEHDILLFVVDERYINAIHTILRSDEFENSMHIEPCLLSPSNIKQSVSLNTKHHQIVLVIDLIRGYSHISEPDIGLFSFTKLSWTER